VIVAQKNNTNIRRKLETFKSTLATYTKHGGGESPTKETDSLAAPNVEMLDRYIHLARARVCMATFSHGCPIWPVPQID
jgi:hypothetical protein